MGGAVAIVAADEPGVERVLGLAPWIPDRLDRHAARGRRLDVLHGSLDRWLPGIPGVSSTSSRGAASIGPGRSAFRAATRGSRAECTGSLSARPSAGWCRSRARGAWARLVAAQLETFVG